MARDSDRLEIIMAELLDMKSRSGNFECKRNILKAIENLVYAKSIKLVEEQQ
jgi:hypothetical protein